jgi:alanyl-tRNA synthetase
MGFERIVSILQGVPSNYKIDLFVPIMDTIQALCGDSAAQREEHTTPYRVIADHARAASFLIADGVVPGNTGRSYICRMIIRRAARFGSKIGLSQPFLAKVAEKVIDGYGAAYPELVRNRGTILDNLTREERRFRRTVESGLTHLDEMFAELRTTGGTVLDGGKAFDLYATHGLPLELTRDIAREQNLEVDEAGFRQAMETHRDASGTGKFRAFVDEDVEVFRGVLSDLQKAGKLTEKGVTYDPYSAIEVEEPVLAILQEGETIERAYPGDAVEVILPHTCFYVESGGQVSDMGTIVSASEPRWEIKVEDVRKPAAGVVVHIGQVVKGEPKVGDVAIAAVDAERRHDIMRNHTATHLLHAELHRVLGDHARQAGSLVAPDRLRFDFTHPEMVTPEQLDDIEAGVNRAILGDFKLKIVQKPLQQAISEGAMALFGEKYGEVVRTITIGEPDPFSYELCGGTHVDATGDIGLFLITSEGSAAAGVRRIEAVTGRGAYELVQKRFRALKHTAGLLSTSVDELPEKTTQMLGDLEAARKQIASLRQEMAASEFTRQLENVTQVNGVPVLAAILPNADADTLRQMTDRFRDKYKSGVVVLASSPDNRPMIIAAVTDDLVKRGLHAGDLAKSAAAVVGGSGGGRPTLAQAGGKDASKLPEAMVLVPELVKQKLKV